MKNRDDSMTLLWKETQAVFNNALNEAGQTKKDYYTLIYDKIISTASKPEGNTGILFSTFANMRPNLYNWTLSKVNINLEGILLDIGCSLGYFAEALGRTIKRTNAKGKVFAIDHSKTMVEQATARNAALIEDGIVSIHQCDASKMPLFEDGFFSCVICMAMAGFFSTLLEPMKEIRRVLSPKGRLILGLQVHECDKLTAEMRNDFKVSRFTIHSRDYLEAVLEESGFSRREVFENDSFHFLLIIAQK